MKNRQIIISTVLIRRGGAPSGAAGFIISGDLGVSTPIIYFFKRSIFHLENLPEIIDLSAMEPRAPGVSSTLAFVEQTVNGHLKQK